MQKVKVIVCGLGKVGRAFLELVSAKAEITKKRYGLDVQIIAASDIDGSALCGSGLPLAEVVANLKKGVAVHSLPDWGTTETGQDVLEKMKAHVFIEATPTNLVHGEPGLSHIRGALERGLHVVSANKGPLVLFYKELHDLARGKGCSIGIGAATAAALPTVDVGSYCLAGADIVEIEGILNGTTNYVLTRMDKEGISYEDALAEAQEKGIAETDPSLDVEGWDTANKMVLIANRVLGASITRNDVEVQGIAGMERSALESARLENKVVKLVGSARASHDGIKVRVGPSKLDIGHPLAAVNGPEKALSYLTDTMDRVTISGGKSSPVGAAAALYKDLVNIFT